jgi:ribokinase
MRSARSKSLSAVWLPARSSRPGVGSIVVVGAHIQGLFMRVSAVPKESESVLGHSFEEPVDGGRATNQAICAARLGVPVRFLTVLGNDERGSRWRQLLELEGIDMGWAITSQKPTDIGFVLLAPNGTAAVATAMEANRELDGNAVSGMRDAFDDAAVVLCQLEAPDEAAVTAFAAARDVEAPTILNPSPPQNLTEELLSLTDLLVANVHEASWLLGVSAPPPVLASRLQRACPGTCVIVTAGAAGAYACDPAGNELSVPALAVDVVDKNGAGDAFAGALAVRLRAGDTLEAAIRYAVIAASVSVTRAGSAATYPAAAEVTTAARVAAMAAPATDAATAARLPSYSGT